MCGIAGFVAEGRRADLERAIEAMAAAEFHRGPDDGGTLVLSAGQSWVGLGNRRLAIIDLSPAGHQPMANGDASVWVTFNGEIYNFAALRAELVAAGYAFRSRTDTEVILHGYTAWGIEGTLKRLRGMFAFAIWDARARQLYIARDRLGEKPIYYALVGGRLVFASELRAIMASGMVGCAPSAAALYAYLALGSVPAPLAIAAPVRTLEPGCYVEFHAGVLSRYRYWEPRGADGVAALGPEETVARLSAMLTDVVRMRLVSDVPLDLFLSGGIDSAAVLALMRRAGAERIRAHTISFADAAFDEAPGARVAARHYGAELLEHRVDAGDLADELPRIIAALDQPSIDGVNTYFVAKYTRAAGTVVALSGLGGDELFGGYSSFRRVPALMRAGGAVRTTGATHWLGARLLELAGGSQRAGRINDFLARRPSAASAYLALRGLLRETEIEQLLDRDLLAEGRRQFDPIGYLERLPGGDEPVAGNAVSALELGAYMHNQLLRDTDVMSMAHGLEVRCPLIDHELVEFVLGIAPALKFGGRPKRLLLRAIGDELPPAIVNRRKRGFSFPFAIWMRGEARQVIADILTSGGDGGVLRRAVVTDLWDGFNRGRVHWSRIWQIAVLQLWLAEFKRAAAEIRPIGESAPPIGAAAGR
jgi:asparagine synthase (glutamine-hydrolysing)